MQYTPDYLLDRFAGVLSAQLLSSQTSGTFQINNASALASQLATMPSGYQCTVTIENEQILCSAFSVSGSTVTCTIATSGRGYNSTQAATHASDTAVEIHLPKGVVANMEDHLKRFDDLGLIIPLGTSVTTISSSSVHTISGDYTTYFTVGRVFLFAVSGTWYRAVVRSSSYGAGTTTINITGDGLVGSGTVTACGFEMSLSTRAPVDYRLVKESTNVPGNNPPSGYSWLFAKSGNWYSKDSSGNIRFLTNVRASASSSSGTLTLDWSAANVYDCTLTENITGVTHQNGVEGNEYVLRIKQHASAAKTVALGTGGGTRFSNDVASYSVTTDLSAIDELTFRYHATDTKYDLVEVMKGFQASPTQTATPFSLSVTAGETIAVGEAVYMKASDGRAWLTDADADEATFSFIGFAASAGTAGNPMTVYLPGAVLDGLSGLTIGSFYFLSGTAGAIANTAHATRVARVAMAITTTKILILQPYYMRSGSQTFASATTAAQTTGFYPAKVYLAASNDASNTTGGSFSGYGATLYEHRAGGVAGAGAVATTGEQWVCKDNNTGTVQGGGAVTTKTQTGFTLNESTHNAGTTTIYWWAESV